MKILHFTLLSMILVASNAFGVTDRQVRYKVNNIGFDKNWIVAQIEVVDGGHFDCTSGEVTFYDANAAQVNANWTPDDRKMILGFLQMSMVNDNVLRGHIKTQGNICKSGWTYIYK